MLNFAALRAVVFPSTKNLRGGRISAFPRRVGARVKTAKNTGGGTAPPRPKYQSIYWIFLRSLFYYENMVSNTKIYLIGPCPQYTTYYAVRLAIQWCFK